MAKHVKPAGGFELAAWFFMRISGWCLSSWPWATYLSPTF